MPEKPSLRSIDLNLLVVFEAIYLERNITRAGHRLALSQPAVSHALRRLRQSLNDELFVKRRGGVAPTPYASTIIQDVSVALDQLRTSLSGEPQFNPASATAMFTITMSLGFESWIMLALHKRLAREAPNVAVNSTRLDRRRFENELANGEVNLAIDIAGPTGADIEVERLIFDRRVVVSAPRNKAATKLNAHSYLGAKHLIVSSRTRGAALEDYDLARSGKKRTISARCSSLSAALRIVSETDLLLTLGARQLESISPQNDLVVQAYPFDEKEIEVMMYWHQSSNQDPRTVWLRGLVKDCISS